MPVDRRLHLEIDYRLGSTLSRHARSIYLDTFLEDIFELLPSRPDDAQATAAYLAYRLSREYIHRRNDAQQAELAEDLGTLLRVHYQEPRVHARLFAAPRPQAFAVLMRLYDVLLALTLNGLGAGQGQRLLDPLEPLRLLRIAVTATWAPWHAILRLSGNVGSYHRVRSLDPGGGQQILVGRPTGQGAEVQVRVATFNMQGSSETSNSKYRLHVLPLARMHHVVALQEAGVAPFSSRHVARLQVADQFGRTHEINHYLWDAGSSGRPETYQIYLLEVQRLRVRLALVVCGLVDVRSVVVVADGIGSPAGSLTPRSALGLRLRIAGLDEEITVFSFHAISNGGVNSPRMLREVSWHSASRYVLVGDFNRDPRAPGPSNPQRGNWISPPGIADLVLAEGPTHPSHGPTSMLDYALVNGSSRPADAGRVGQIADSDHLPVSFSFHFSN